MLAFAIQNNPALWDGLSTKVNKARLAQVVAASWRTTTSICVKVK
ncbi:MAG TPA: hypothetical protein VF172_12185 [Nitrososphaera sp.]